MDELDRLADDAVKDGISQSGELSYDRIRHLGETIVLMLETIERLESEYSEADYDTGYAESEWEHRDDYDNGYAEGLTDGREEGYTEGFIEGRRIEALDGQI